MPEHGNEKNSEIELTRLKTSRRERKREREWGLNKYIRTVFIWSFSMLSALCLPFKSVHIMFSFIYVFVCVCSSTYSRAYKEESSSYLFLHIFFVKTFFFAILLVQFVSALERIRFNSWLFTLEVRAMDRNVTGWEYILLCWYGSDSKIDYVRISHSHIQMQCNVQWWLRESGITQVAYLQQNKRKRKISIFVVFAMSGFMVSVMPKASQECTFISFAR